MSNQLFKQIRSYAKLRGLEYSKCKAVFLRATKEEQEIFRQEIKNAPHNFPPPIKNGGERTKPQQLVS